MSLRLNSRIFTNSFAGKEREMAFPFKPNNYFGFQNKPQYSESTFVLKSCKCFKFKKN